MTELHWPKVTLRWARVSDIPYLAQRLSEDRQFERVDLEKSVVRVAEYDGKTVGFGAAHLTWRVEPIFLFPEFKKLAPHMAQRRATYLLIRDLDQYVMGEEVDGLQDHSGIRQYFCFICDKVMQKLALSFNMIPAYTGGKFFGRRLFGRD